MIRHIGVRFRIYGTTSKFNIQILKYRIRMFFKIVIRSLGWFI